MASQTVSSSAQLRTAIQQANSGDIITLNGNNVAFDVLTLAKNVCGSSEPTTLDSNYTIEGNGSTLLNTRIFQTNVDGPYGPGTVKGTAANLTLSYASGGGATANSPLFTAVNADYSLTALTVTGDHTGWTGNGGKYFSVTAFGTNTVSAKIDLTGSLIDVTGQAGFNPLATNAGGSAFLHSWNNSYATDLDDTCVTLQNNTFDESGFLSSFNFYNQTYNNALFKGKYLINGNTFTRSSANRVFHANEGNRLTNVQATFIDNTFEHGSYLDLYGTVSDVVFGAGTNTFRTVAGGYGIRANSNVVGSIATLGTGAYLYFDVSQGGDLNKLIYNDSDDNQSVFTLLAGTNDSNITLQTDPDPLAQTREYGQLSAGGRGNDAITASTTAALWANGDAGNDTITGGNANDELFGGADNDLIDGAGGANHLHGDSGNDTLTAGGGADTLEGGTGNDSLNSGSGNDMLYGEDGDDTLLGGAGLDNLSGGDGNDNLTGGTSNDTLTGGNGNDIFRMATGDGIDRITDFSRNVAGNTDQIGLANIFGGTGNATLPGSAFLTNTSTITGIQAGSSNKVICMQGSLTTSQITGNLAPSGSASPAYVVVFNSNATGGARGQLWYDPNWNDVGGRVQLATFDTFTSLSDVTSLTASNFFAYA
jgi:Ca2+-binding RTX toxin-like protein